MSLFIVACTFGAGSAQGLLDLVLSSLLPPMQAQISPVGVSSLLSLMLGVVDLLLVSLPIPSCTLVSCISALSSLQGLFLFCLMLNSSPPPVPQTQISSIVVPVIAVDLTYVDAAGTWIVAPLRR